MSETAIQPKDDNPAFKNGKYVPFWWRDPSGSLAGCDTCDELLTFLTNGYSSELHIKRIDEWGKHMVSKHSPRNQRQGNGKYLGAWAFTLTMSPKDGLTIGDMLTAVRKVMKQKSNIVKRYAWYYEDKGRDDNGDAIHPHIHGMYETVTGGRIEKKHFKRAWSIWGEGGKPMGAGFRGGYHRPVRNEERYEDYMKKDGGMSECLMDDQTE